MELNFNNCVIFFNILVVMKTYLFSIFTFTLQKSIQQIQRPKSFEKVEPANGKIYQISQRFHLNCEWGEEDEKENETKTTNLEVPAAPHIIGESGVCESVCVVRVCVSL